MAEECEQFDGLIAMTNKMNLWMRVYWGAIALQIIGWCGIAFTSCGVPVFEWAQKDTTLMFVISIVFTVFTFLLGRTAYGNYMRAWRIAEIYRHKKFVIDTFNAQFDKLQNCSSCKVLNQTSDSIVPDVVNGCKFPGRACVLMRCIFDSRGRLPSQTRDTPIICFHHNNAVMRKPVTASCADYKLVEMLIEVLTKDPLKNFGP